MIVNTNPGGGGSLFRHTILLDSGGNVPRASLIIYVDTVTPFNFSALNTWLNTNGYNSITSCKAYPCFGTTGSKDFSAIAYETADSLRALAWGEYDGGSAYFYSYANISDTVTQIL